MTVNNLKLRIKLDIPFDFNYIKYSVSDLLIFRQFFDHFYLDQEFDFDLIKRIVDFNITLEEAKTKYNEYQNIWN